MFGEANEEYTISSSTYYIADNLQPKEVDLPSTKKCCHRYFDPLREGSLRGSIANSLGLTVNSGCFMYPFILSKFGICHGIIFIILIGVVNYCMIKFLLFSILKTKIRSYQLLIEKIIGTTWKQVYNMINLITILLMITSLIHIQDVLIHKMLGENNHMLYYILLKIFSCLIIQIPLVFIKKAPYNYITSIIGLLLFVYVIAVIIYHMIINIKKDNIEFFTIVEWYDYIIAFGFINSSFLTQNGMTMLSNNITDPTKRRTNKVINVSFIMQVLFTFILSVAGYFFNKYEDIYLILFTHNDTYTHQYDRIITISVMICLIVSIHLFMPVRWYVFRSSLNGLTEESWIKSKIKICIILLCIVLLNIISHFDFIVLPLTCFYGGFLAVLITCIFPTVIYANIYGKNWVTISCFSISFLFMIVGLSASILSFTKLFTIFCR